MIQVAFFFGAVFFICMGATFIIWIKYFPLVKKYDVELYEQIRFKWSAIFGKAYGRYIFKKEYLKAQDKNLVRYSNVLFWLGYIGQWAFNIYILMALYMIIFE